jgi:hypothetical protein
MCVIDECFAAGTPIAAPEGTVAIESLSAGDIVLGSNGPVAVKKLIVKHTNVIACLHLSNGDQVWCTPNHPLFTDQGWMCAGNAVGRELYGPDEVLRLVQKEKSEIAQEQILRNILLSEMEDATARDSSKDLYRRAFEESICSFEGKEARHPFMEQRHSYERVVKKEAQEIIEGYWMETSSRRREWTRSDETSGCFAGEIRLFLDTGGRNRIGREASRLSNMLQSGPWQCVQEMGNRVRWGKSQQQVRKGETQEERGQDSRVRVESVEVIKFKGTRTVYDLELEGTPHFFANGVLSHNSTCIKNHSSQRTKFINSRLAPLADYRYILTGTVSPNSPLDVYSQFQFLGPKILGFSSYYAFRARYAVMKQLPIGGRQVPVVVNYRDIDELRSRLAPHSHRVRLEDCYDMTDPTYAIRHVEMTDDQKRIYNELKHFATAQLAEEQFVSAQQVITQILRLHQVLCGHTVDETGERHMIAENRTNELLNLLEEYDGKAIIWCSYDNDIRKVSERLRKDYGEGSVARFWGGNQSTREQEEVAFKTDPACRFMVATAAAGGRGRTWDVADLTVYYSNTQDLEHREQSEARPKGVGKKRPLHYVDLMVPGTVDEKIIKALRNKINMAATISGDSWKEWVV